MERKYIEEMINEYNRHLAYEWTRRWAREHFQIQRTSQSIIFEIRESLLSQNSPRERIVEINFVEITYMSIIYKRILSNKIWHVLIAPTGAKVCVFKKLMTRAE